MDDCPDQEVVHHVGPVHIVPDGDLIEHTLCSACVCGPRAEPVKQDDGSIDWVYVHHSLDGRELAQ